jgi:sortase (surface protein transpeptidase)
VSLQRSAVVLLALLILTAVMASAKLGTEHAPEHAAVPTTGSSISMSLATPIPLRVSTPEALTDVAPLVPPTTSATTPTPGSTVTPASAPDITPAPPVSAPSMPQATPVRVVDAPLRLRIPALGIDAAVQWVGVDEQGRMGVPNNYTDVAWYELGPRPGMPGNAVIAGHLDSTTGPAVFFRLDALGPGDELFVVTHGGEELRFVVEGLEAYAVNDAPLDRIFGPAPIPRLNLITCDGTFDWSRREYDQRLVVYAVAG